MFSIGNTRREFTPEYKDEAVKLVVNAGRLATVAARAGTVAATVWVADSTPVETGRSPETVHRSDLAGWAEYGYCASHSRYFWGPRLHLVCTLHGLPIGFALTGAKADEREVLVGILEQTPHPIPPGGTVIADKNLYGREFENTSPTLDSRSCGPRGKESNPAPAPSSSNP